MKQECSKIVLIDRENNSLFYKNAWNLCKNEQECKTVLFELDNFLILENSEVAEKKDNTLTFLNYNKFYCFTINSTFSCSSYNKRNHSNNKYYSQ